MDSGRCSFLAAFAVFAISWSPLTQQPISSNAVQRDAQAISILTQSVAAAGGTTAIEGAQDCTADGTITYYSAGQEIQGTVTIKSRGMKQFRFDATLPQGVRSVVVDGNFGQEHRTDGIIASLPYSSTMQFDSFTFPAGKLSADLQDSSTSVSYLGIVTYEEHQAHQIRLRNPAHPASGSADNAVRTRDYFIDSTSFQVLALRSKIYSAGSPSSNLSREMRYTDYRTAQAVSVPFSIDEFIEGQRVFTISLNNVTFNAGLDSSVFQF